jgi:hypothetical protein
MKNEANTHNNKRLIIKLSDWEGEDGGLEGEAKKDGNGIARMPFDA